MLSQNLPHQEPHPHDASGQGAYEDSPLFAALPPAAELVQLVFLGSGYKIGSFDKDIKVRVVVALANLLARGVIFIYFSYSFLHFLLKKALNCMPIMLRASSFISPVYKNPLEFILSMLIKLNIANSSRQLS
jgi:hypothetical protein